jgi:hypothetical protein
MSDSTETKPVEAAPSVEVVAAVVVAEPSKVAEAAVVAVAVPTVEDFVKMCLAGVDKKPTNKKEALALFKYVMASKVEPLIEAVLEGCIEKLPADQQAIARQVLNGVEAVSKMVGGCGCF